MRKRFLAIFTTIILFLSSCGGGDNKSSTLYKIMPLGDSITYDDANAYYDSNGNNLVPAGKRTAYRSFLAWNLDDAGYKYDFVGSRRAGYNVEPKFDPDNEGHPGWTSYQIADNVYKFLEENPADIILLHAGTNDGSRKPSIDGIKKIVSEIKRYEKDHNKNIKIFVALIINRWFWDKSIEEFDNNLREYLSNLNDKDIITVDMSHLLGGDDYLEYTHPNKQGYKKMADKWFEALSDYIY